MCRNLNWSRLHSAFALCNLDQLLALLKRTKIARFEDVFSLRNRYTLFLGRRIVLSLPPASLTMSIIPSLSLESERGSNMESTVVDQPRPRPLRMEARSTGKCHLFFYTNIVVLSCLHCLNG